MVAESHSWSRFDFCHQAALLFLRLSGIIIGSRVGFVLASCIAAVKGRKILRPALVRDIARKGNESGFGASSLNHMLHHAPMCPDSATAVALSTRDPNIIPCLRFFFPSSVSGSAEFAAPFRRQRSKKTPHHLTKQHDVFLFPRGVTIEFGSRFRHLLASGSSSSGGRAVVRVWRARSKKWRDRGFRISALRRPKIV